MKAIEMKKDVYWVGGIDWDLRSFHGYLTQRGSTYNAYLIVDEKITLIDTVKHYLVDELLERISHVVDPAKIDYLLSNHVEMDHSGGLPKLKEVAPNANASGRSFIWFCTSKRPRCRPKSRYDLASPFSLNWRSVGITSCPGLT